MTEGIVWNEIGTVDVTFDDKTYHLGTPKLRQWRYFTGQIESMTADAREKFNELSVRVAYAANAIEDAADPVLLGVLEVAREKLKADPNFLNVQVRDRAWGDIVDAAAADLKAEHATASEALQKYADIPFYLTSSVLLREMFEQLGDPLPGDIDEWPAWLATDVSLPGLILQHWKTHPKASGDPAPR